MPHWCQELISKRTDEDQDHRELDEGEVVVGFAVATDRDPTPRLQPGVRALDRPALTRLRIARLEAALLAAPDLAGRAGGRDRLATAAAFADTRLDAARA